MANKMDAVSITLNADWTGDFWRPLDDQNHFFEKPLVEFTDRTWGK